jgi:beta-phosphoglucomutase
VIIKAVIFDMDGVLIDAKEWHYESLNDALSNFGYEISHHDHLVTYDGLPTKNPRACTASLMSLNNSEQWN